MKWFLGLVLAAVMAFTARGMPGPISITNPVVGMDFPVGTTNIQIGRRIGDLMANPMRCRRESSRTHPN
ncbi:MAG: hypothetical protein R6X19_06770 [Kiritimatiellia bacterium]